MFVVVVCSEGPDHPQFPQHVSWRYPLNDALWLRSYEQIQSGIITQLRRKKLQVQARTVSRLQEAQALKF
jgi:hypothetical protein